MNFSTILLAVSLCVSISGLSQTECFQVLDIIDAPSTQNQGLAYDGTHLWSAQHTSITAIDLIHQISTVDGTVIHTIPTGTSTYVGGLAFVGGTLWMTDRDNIQLLALSTDDGSITNSIQLDPDRFNGETLILGLAEEDGDLWFSARFQDDGVDSTYRISTSGIILEAYEAHGETPSGMAHDESTLWFGNNGANSSIQRIDSDFNVIETYAVPGGNFPNGLAYDGMHLWISENSSNSIYKMSICPLTQPPYFESLSDSYSQECNPDGVDPTALGILAIDPDGSAVTLSFELTDFIQISCGSGLGIYIYTVIATDGQGESAIGTFEINYFDTTPPSLFIPSNATIECGDDVPEPSASVEDECGFASWSVSEAFESLCGGTEQITRTYTAMDDCGNAVSSTQTITIVDTTPPEVNAASNVTIECGNAVPPASADPTDFCGNATWTVFESFDPLCGAAGTVFRTYIATDDCGNTATEFQIITILDATPPVLVCPPNATVDDIENANPSETGTAAASDLCGGVSLDFFDGPITGVPGSFVRTWIASDNCGNTSVCDQSISESDCAPLSITALPSQTVECGDDMPGEDYTVTGGCPPFEVEILGDALIFCGQTGEIALGYFVTDAAGNMASYFQEITIVDTTPPDVNAASNVTIECGSAVPTASADPTDLCGNATWTVSETFDPLCGAAGTLFRTYIATDECGNTATESQAITIVDTTAPELVCPPNVNVDDIENANPSETGTATGTDLCGDVSIEFIDGPITGVPGSFIRTWIATDDCGNSSSCGQSISESECDPLNINSLPDLTIECGSEIPTGDYTVSGGCPPLEEVEISESQVSDCGDTFVLTRTYVVTDGAGTMTTATQVITIVDTTAPTISANSDATVECGDEFDLAGATVSDACGGVTIESDSAFVADCGDTGVWTISYTATDDCGNTATGVQTITLIDTTPPSLDCPVDVVVSDINDEEETDSSETGEATASDNCGDASVPLHSDSEIENLQFVRTWTATDECGNSSVCDQIISEIVGLLEDQASVDFSVYPNPSNGQFTLHLNESLSEGFTWTCFDLVGKVVMSGQNQSVNGRTELDLPGIAMGGYFLLVEFEEVRGIQKIQIYR